MTSREPAGIKAATQHLELHRPGIKVQASHLAALAPQEAETHSRQQLLHLGNWVGAPQRGGLGSRSLGQQHIQRRTVLLQDLHESAMQL